MLKPVLFCLI